MKLRTVFLFLCAMLCVYLCVREVCRCWFAVEAVRMGVPVVRKK